MTMLKKVILCPNPYRDKELRVAKEAKAILDEVHCPNVVCIPFRGSEEPEGYGLEIRPLQQELRGSDIMLSFAGDGTILQHAKTAAHNDIPLLGINLGSLGFMAELEQKELHKLRQLVDRNYLVESRMMLDVCVRREGRVIYSSLALNEALIARGNVSRVIRLHIFTESGKLVDVAGDGVVVASPTGSTAYSLSAGGPVVEPTARNFVVSPICAHSVHANSYVLSPERTITVQTEATGYKPVVLSVDGGRAFSLRHGDSVEITRSRFDTKLVRLENRSFCDVLQRKMLGGLLEHEE
ncbi:MAG: NAD(+)/NADH kinase [Oscillospiraceae bacterium]|nr:NAD(+)/NADH kinase [Oscillospiraceae bacterium]